MSKPCIPPNHPNYTFTNRDLEEKNQRWSEIESKLTTPEEKQRAWGKFNDDERARRWCMPPPNTSIDDYPTAAEIRQQNEEIEREHPIKPPISIEELKQLQSKE